VALLWQESRHAVRAEQGNRRARRAAM